MTHKLDDIQAQKQALKPETLRSPNGDRLTHDDGFDALYLEIGRRVRHYRKERGFTQTALEKASGVSHVALNQLENRGQRASVHTLYVLAYLLDVSIYDLLPEQIPGMEDEQP